MSFAKDYDADSAELPIETTKAGFRALRELAGLTQQDIADAMVVSLRSAQRWEMTNDEEYNNAPAAAWEFLIAQLDNQEGAADAYVAQAEETIEEAGHNPENCLLVYYPSQAIYTERTGRLNSYGAANAISREIARRLMLKGYTVKFVYPNDEDNPLPAQIS